MKPEKLAVDRVIHDLQSRAGDFRCGECVLADSLTGYKYWVAGLFFDAGIYRPYVLPFGFVQGWRFRRALKQWKVAVLLEASGT